MKTYTHLPLSLISIGLCFLLSACNADKNKEEVKAPVIRPVKTIIAVPENDLIARTYSAVVSSTQQVELSFRVSGKLQELPIKNGDRVKKGDVIAKLDERDFKANISQTESQINQANAQLKALRAGARPEDIAALNAAVKAAKSEVQKAQSQYNRTEGLVKKQVIARQELDNDRNALTVAKANLDAKKQELIKGKAGGRKEDISAQIASIQGLKSQLKNLKETLEDATLRAPFDGIISSHNAENFSNIQAKENIATIHKASEERNIVFNIPAPDIVVLSPEQDNLTLTVTLDSFPDRKFEAYLNEFSREADAVTQTYEGTVSIKNTKKEPILPGMTGNLHVMVNGNKRQKYALPLSAITSNSSGEPFVWIVDDMNQVFKRTVSLGDTSDVSVAILKGITEGDIIVTAGISALQDKMKVKPITAVGE